MYYERVLERIVHDDDVGMETIVVEEEKEVEVDIADVLSECPPEEDWLTFVRAIVWCYRGWYYITRIFKGFSFLWQG